MKSTKIVIINLLLSIAFCSACLDAIEIPDDFKVKRKIDDMQLIAEITAHVINPTAGESFQICTNLTNCNLVKTSPSIKLSGLVTEVNQSGEFKVADGVLYLCLEFTNCNLIGYYSGNGISDDFGVRISALINIDQGNGQFMADGGQLQLTLIGERLSKGLQDMKYTIDVNGYLSNEIDN